MSGGESIIFEGITYTANTTVNILINTTYLIEAVPSPGYILTGWGSIGGVSFEFLSGNTWTFSMNFTGGSSITPQYEEIPSPTPTVTPTMTETPTNTPSETVTPTPSITETTTNTPTPTPTTTPTQTAPLTGFTSIWTAESGLSNTIELPYSPTGTYSGTIDWGDGSISSNTYANRVHNYASSGDYTVTINGTIEGWKFSTYATSYKDSIKEIIRWGTLKGESNYNIEMFFNCTNLVLTGVTDTPDLSTILSLQNMLSSCTSITTINNINNWDISNVTSLNYLFAGCINFNDDLSSWNMSNILGIIGTFSACGSYNNLGQSLNSWNTSNMLYMNNAFNGASSFNISISGWDVSNVISLDFFNKSL
jgi:surface protein